MKRVIPVDQPGNVTIYLPDPIGDENPQSNTSVTTATKKKNSDIKNMIKIMFISIFIMLFALVVYGRLRDRESSLSLPEQPQQLIQQTDDEKQNRQWFEWVTMPDSVKVRVWRGMQE